MAKDPAFLFFPGDWLGGTLTFSRHQKGCYLDLLMAQFSEGRLTLADIKEVLGEDFESQWESKLKKKFTVDDNGHFYNKKLDDEINKRRSFSESRRSNRKTKKEDMSPHMNNHMNGHMTNHMSSHMENGDGIGNKKEIKDVFDYFCLKLTKKILLSKERSKIIENRLKEGRTVEEMRKAVDNFAADEWQDRHRFCDVVYVVGVRNKVDNLDKWLATKRDMRPVATKGHPKDCSDCWGSGLRLAPGSGKQTPCLQKY